MSSETDYESPPPTGPTRQITNRCVGCGKPITVEAMRNDFGYWVPLPTESEYCCLPCQIANEADDDE